MTDIKDGSVIEEVVEVFTAEQIEILPEETKTAIIALEQDLPKKELAVLNPLVVELLKAKELAKIQYVPKPEAPADGKKFSKEELAPYEESVAAYKAAKKQLVEVKKKAADAKKQIKGPLDEMGKKVVTIEKGVLEILTEITETLEGTFKPYIDDEAAKAKAAQERREKASKDKIDELANENEQKNSIIEKGRVVNFLKYEMIEPTETEVHTAIEKYSLDKLYETRDGLKFQTFEKLSAGKDLTLLDPEELTEIETKFNQKIFTLTTNLNNRINVLELAKDNEKLSDQVESANQSNGPLQNAPSKMDVDGDGGVMSFATPGTPADNLPTPNMNVPRDYVNEALTQINLAAESVGKIAFDMKANNILTWNDEKQAQYHRLTGAIKLLQKTNLYILNQLPPKQAPAETPQQQNGQA